MPTLSPLCWAGAHEGESPGCESGAVCACECHLDAIEEAALDRARERRQAIADRLGEDDRSDDDV